MATIKGFKCVRPYEDLADKIAALPYDVYNRKEAKKVVEENELSFLKIDRAETMFDDSVDTYADCVYEKARELLDEMIDDGSYLEDTDNALYIYELTMNGRVQTGIVGCASVDDYENNVIKKHENTRADKEEDRIRHVDTCDAQTGPIFLAYRSNDVINEVVNNKRKEKPLYDFVSDDAVRHTVWKIAEPENIKAIEEAFDGISNIYIADGHHRCASAVKVGLKRREENPGYTGKEEFNFFLSVLFPDDQLMIMDYNRVVKDLNGLSETEFLIKLAEKFDFEEVSQPFSPKKKGEIGMCLKGQWYHLTVHEELMVDDPVNGLDVAILQNELLLPVLGIKDPKTDKRIDFVGGIRGIKELERRVQDDMCVAFAMYPTSISELFAVADAGMLMPPKSTWFEPKLRSGIFIHKLT